MSVELHVLLTGSRLPGVRQWQEAITALGFELQLEVAGDLRARSGFLPVSVGGESSGFEFDVRPSKEIVVGYPGLASRAMGRELSANFRFGGDLTEMACAMAASAALAKLGDGIWFDPQDADTEHSIDDAIALARAAIVEATESKRRQLGATLPRSAGPDNRSWLDRLFGRRRISRGEVPTMKKTPALIVAAKDEVFDALFRQTALIAKLPEGSAAETEYVEMDTALIRRIEEVGRGLFTSDFVEKHIFVSDNWWPDHTRGVDASIDAFTQAYYDGLRAVLAAAPPGWRIQVVVYGDPRNGKTMIGSVAIWADRVLIDRALYGLLVWRGIDLRCGSKLTWRERADE